MVRHCPASDHYVVQCGSLCSLYIGIVRDKTTVTVKDKLLTTYCPPWQYTTKWKKNDQGK